ncbi:Ppx-GppA-domain-containing protein [Coniochaeta sp. PMI_546]|nr:Ppx-GppA-domain-containing protein [Coniochaeta sp. PMI_546]
MDSLTSDFELLDDSVTLVDAEPQAGHQQQRPNIHLRGVVDMGSNGIRFSVTDLSPPFSRILPTVHVYRVDISLYDAQFDAENGSKRPIPKEVIADVIAALVRFKIVCADLGVPEKNIHILATEATRGAINSAEFLRAIFSATGLPVDTLRKEDEGRIGALGVASGFSDIEGLMMDLGGGSTQITWLISQGGNVRISQKGSFSFPYGAAALTRKLAQLKKGKSKKEAEDALAKLRDEMVTNFQHAYKDLAIPASLVENAQANGGFQLYLSGGGFRGWGYLLLYMSEIGKKPHPISIINGYTVGRERFENTDALEEVARTAHSVFRVSDRRRKQVPAVAFLINVLSRAIPHGFRNAHFCQGGVREGFLFRELPPSIRLEDPLEVTTQRFAPSSVTAIFRLMMFSIPRLSAADHHRFPSSISAHVVKAFANVLYVHSVMDKETASTAALYSTSAGLLSSTHGVSHEDRARLALMLESRYMGELPPREVEFREALRRLLSPEEIWWTGYLGRVGYLTSRLYPSGRVDEVKPRVVYSAEWASNLGRKRSREGLRLIISIQKVRDDPARLKEALIDHVRIVEKIGKKKHWIGGEEGWGMKVQVNIVEEDIL